MTWVFVVYSYERLSFGYPAMCMFSGTKRDMSRFPPDLRLHLCEHYYFVYYVECNKCVCPVYFNSDEPTTVKVIHLGKKNEVRWGAQLREELMKIS